MVDNKLAYTPVEVAQLLGLHINSVRKYVQDGTLPSFRLGRKVLIPRIALERLLEAATDGKTPGSMAGGK